MHVLKINAYADLVAETSTMAYPGDRYKDPAKFTVFHCRKDGEGKVFENKQVGEFTLQSFPSCPAIVISLYSVLNDKPWDLGRYFHALKELVAREAGYSKMLATADVTNFKETIGAAKAGWRLGEAFKNSHTNHLITLMQKDL